MADKDWDDMTPDEKANSLREQIENIVLQANLAINQLSRRVAAIEADLKKSKAGQ